MCLHLENLLSTWCGECCYLPATWFDNADRSCTCESYRHYVRIGTYRSPLWLWPTMGQPQKLASIGSQVCVYIQILSTQGTPQKYPTGVVWGVHVGDVWGMWCVCEEGRGEQWVPFTRISPFPSVSHFLMKWSVWGTRTWVCYNVTMGTYNQMTYYKAPEFQPARNNLLPDTQH